MIPEQAIIAAKEAMREVTPPPGVSKADWLAEHGSFALIAGAIAAAAPYMRSISAEDIAAVADMIKAAKAAGWDEGQKSGMRHARRLVRAAEMGRPELPGPISPNPYRKP